MNMKYLKPSPKRSESKRQSVHAVFGSVSQFPSSYLAGNQDFTNQNSDNRPNECTAYSIQDGVTSVQKINISRDFQYFKTLQIENDATDKEVSMDTAFEVPSSVGVLLTTQEPSGLAQMPESQIAESQVWPLSLYTQTTKIPISIPVVPAPGQDWYDAIKSALMQGKTWNGIVSVGTQWSNDFENVGSSGILTDNPANLYWGHCHNYCGWEVNEDGIERLNDKTWQGPNYGKNGWDFASRILVNKLMGAYGAQARLFMNQSSPVLEKQNLIMVLIDYIQDLFYAIGNVIHDSTYKVANT